MYSCMVTWINKYGAFLEYETDSYNDEKKAWNALIKYLKRNNVSIGTVLLCKNGKKYDEVIICI